MANVEKLDAPLKSPLTVSLWITESCNLDCEYCYVDANLAGDFMDTKRLKNLISELAELEVFDITIAGGEPFLHPDILDIIEHTLSKNIQLGVLTNGVLIDEELSKKLAEIVANKSFILQVSLDSHNPDINNMTRGKGEVILKNLRRLVNLGIEIQLSCVLNSHNIDFAHLMIEEFYPHIKRFHFLNIQRTEKSLKQPKLLISEQQAYDFWMNLRDYAKKFPSDLFLPSLRIMLRSYGEEDCEESQSFHESATFSCKSCSVGITKVEIDSNFNVLGCDIAKDFSKMGNVKNTTFKDVWNSKEAFMVRNSPFPPCYKIKSPDGKSLKDNLKLEYNI